MTNIYNFVKNNQVITFFAFQLPRLCTMDIHRQAKLVYLWNVDFRLHPDFDLRWKERDPRSTEKCSSCEE